MLGRHLRRPGLADLLWLAALLLITVLFCAVALLLLTRGAQA